MGNVRRHSAFSKRGACDHCGERYWSTNSSAIYCSRPICRASRRLSVPCQRCGKPLGLVSPKAKTCARAECVAYAITKRASVRKAARLARNDIRGRRPPGAKYYSRDCNRCGRHYTDTLRLLCRPCYQGGGLE